MKPQSLNCLATEGTDMFKFKMPGQSHSGSLPELTDEEAAIRDRLREHVQVLADDIGERHMGTPDALQAAADYVTRQFEASGYTPNEQTYDVDGETVRNIEFEKPGGDRKDEIIVVGAHYDSVSGCPAANDNGTGVAGMLEIARRLKEEPFPRTLRFVAFVNEEPPFFLTEQMGSLVYARRCQQRNERVVAMLSLETIGCYSDEKGSQFCPPLLSMFYPSQGNFIGFVANPASRDLLERVIADFREHTPFPSEGLVAPEIVTGVGWSDHWSFWQVGVPAVMVTDTAPFRYPHYHAATDTPDKVDFHRTARVVAGLARVVTNLAAAE